MTDTIRVLVVDEDQDVLDLTATFLERESDQIATETVRDANSALDRIEAGSLDCVVSDYRMPEMNGIEFYEALRDRGADIPFVLFSAAVDQQTIDRAEDAGVTNFIKKGAGTDHYREMVSTIESVVAD